MINPTPEDIGSLLNSSSHFSVPRYQREYKWRTNEAGEFWEDLESYAESSDGSLFLGTLIFDISGKDQKVIRIVDGQQRITTILILLIACRNLAKAINSINIASKIQDKISFVDPTTAEFLGCRLLASESIKEIFEHISNQEWNGIFPERIGTKQVRRQTNRIRPIYEYFAKKISTYDQKSLSKLLSAIYESYVIRIDIEDEIEAFKIFERTNARGMDLEVSDLLKNYLFSQAGNEVEDYWYRIIDLSEGTVLRMLKYFYVSKNGYVTKSELYRKLRAHGKTIGALKLVQELEEFASFYKAIRSADEPTMKNYFDSIELKGIVADQEKFQQIYSSIEGLRLFKITQIYPLISAALNCYIRDGLRVDENRQPSKDRSSPKKLVRFFTILENYHFINNAICERIGNEVEKLYSEYSEMYANSDIFDVITSNFFSAIKAQTAVKEEFVSRFIDISYQPGSIPLISYIFDRINNQGLAPGQRIKIFNPDENTLRKNHNIEHFYPQNPVQTPDSPSLTSEDINNIGNLLSISYRTNSRLGNLTPKEKLEKLKGDLAREIRNLDYVNEFIEEYKEEIPNWNEEAISTRARNIANKAYSSVWNIGV